jgi:cytoskeleton protein RodZ
MNESPETAHAVNADDQGTPLPGDILRAEREARGLTVHQVASELHVADGMLLALEKDDFDAIGATIFVKGHLRNYARLLGLDPIPLLDAYDQHARPAPPELVGRRPEGIPVQSDSGGPLLKIAGWVFVLILLLAAAGWWYYQQETVQGMADRIDILMSTDMDETARDKPADTDGADDTRIVEPSFADRLALAEETTGKTPDETDPRATIASPAEGQPDLAETGEQSVQEQQSEVESSVATESGDTSEGSGPVATQDTQSRSTDSAMSGSAPTADATVATGNMQLEFNDASWAEIYNAAGDVLLYDLVPADTTRRIEAAGEVRVFLGNAPAVDIILNGNAFETERFIRRDNTARFHIDLTPTE